jgi:hypothetical protein
MTGNQINTSVNTLKAIKFGRVEDLVQKEAAALIEAATRKNTKTQTTL